MKIHLPEHLERYVHDQVQAGSYPTEDDVIRDALERHRQAGPTPVQASGQPGVGLGIQSPPARPPAEA